MNDCPREIELKLDLDPADRVALLAASQLAEAAGRSRQLLSTYYDTPDCDLQRAGYSLRVRRSGAQYIQTIKQAGDGSAGLFDRPEWECPIAGQAPRLDAHDGLLAGVVGQDALDRLAPAFATDMRRTTYRIESGDTAIEMAVDEGEIRAGERGAKICEVELELRRGSPQALFDMARALDEQVPLRLGVRSKAERGYALLAEKPRGAVKAEPIALDPESDAGEAFRVVAQACIRQFRLNEALLLESGEVEALHQARVALRRLRSAFSLWRRLFAGDSRAALLEAELRWLAAELGEVRNLDVLIARCGRDDRLVAARAERFAHVRAELASARTRLLMIDLTEWLATGSWRSAHPKRAHKPIGRFARKLLEARRERLEKSGEGLAGLDDAQRHKVRIEAKKLRYASDFFASLYPGDKQRRRHRKFLDALKALQDLLGELNDLATAPQLLASLGMDPVVPGSEVALRDQAEAAFETLAELRGFW